MSGRQFLVVRCGDGAYAIALEAVREVAGTLTRRSLPAPPAPWVLGIAALRGELLPVVDLAARVGLAPVQDEPTYVIVEAGGVRCAVAVARVDRLVTVAAADLTPAPPYAGESAEALFALGDDLVVVVRLGALAAGLTAAG